MTSASRKCSRTHSSLNNIELELHTTQLRALEKQVYRDLEKEGDIDYDSMESLVRDVAGARPA